MKWRILAGALGAMCWMGGLSVAVPAQAQEAEEEEEVERVTGRKPPPLPTEPKSAHMDFENDAELTHAEYAERPYPNSAYIGADALDLDPQYVYEVQQGVEKLYLRDYSGTRDHFEALDTAFPGTGIGAVVDVLVWQALMLENFDYKFDKQYWTSSSRAREELGVAVTKPGAEAWEQLLLCGIAGIESIHTMRQSQYTKALSLAFEAMGHLKQAKESAPELPDLMLADGMYNYWRTVVTMSSKVLPDFGDHRVEGIEQMRVVERSAVFLGPAATLSLAFTWIEEGDLKRALNSCVRNRKAYPKNIINNLVTGTTYFYLKKHENALGVFNEILAEDPKNKRVRYWRSVAMLRSGQVDEALAEIQTYLGFDYMEEHQRASAYWRLGQIQQAKKDWGAAYDAYKQAIKINGHKGAKRAADKLKERKKEGKINW